MNIIICRIKNPNLTSFQQEKPILGMGVLCHKNTLFMKFLIFFKHYISQKVVMNPAFLSERSQVSAYGCMSQLLT